MVAYGNSEIQIAILYVKLYMFVAMSMGNVKPNVAVIVPIKISGIIAIENIGKNIKFPIKLYVGNAPKCIATNGAVNIVATTDVKTAIYVIFIILFCGIFGFTHAYNQTRPNTAANDN